MQVMMASLTEARMLVLNLALSLPAPMVLVGLLALEFNRSGRVGALVLFTRIPVL